jgi:hypothetical protein
MVAGHSVDADARSAVPGCAICRFSRSALLFSWSWLLQLFTAKKQRIRRIAIALARPDFVLQAMQTVGVNGNVSFSNKQKFTINSSQYIQHIDDDGCFDYEQRGRLLDRRRETLLPSTHLPHR